MKTHILLFTAVALLITGCGKKDLAHAQAEEAATTAALDWLKLIDDGNYAGSWEQSAAPFKNASTAESWAKMLEPIRPGLGKVESREVDNRSYMTTIPNAPKGEYVIIQFKTNFENQKGAIETVTPMLEDGKWKVSGYYIK